MSWLEYMQLFDTKYVSDGVSEPLYFAVKCMLL
jgi:hypothetical protein